MESRALVPQPPSTPRARAYHDPGALPSSTTSALTRVLPRPPGAEKISTVQEAADLIQTQVK